MAEDKTKGKKCRESEKLLYSHTNDNVLEGKYKKFAVSF
jgi:hypothetical protein